MLATAVDAYATTWTLVRCGRVYTMSVFRLDQEVETPAGPLVCPFSFNSSWLPNYSVASSSVSQRGTPWNVSVYNGNIVGWMYGADTGQRFANLTWIK